ncbi:hypothetical protein [Nocardia rhizosphaerae]|uniref:Uncharacterized protein n=1 Tax=Nocardia rhizosphaerae TaxID=1691571 RepID=A0ABV8L932_9NOCA
MSALKLAAGTRYGDGTQYDAWNRPTAVPWCMGGSVTHPVMVDGRRVGWVGDIRRWRGHRHGGRRWWACWREDGDTHARWSEFEFGTRRAALAALTERIEGAR